MEFWLAPLHGITNHHFRNCLNRHVNGIDVAVTPFLAVQEKGKLNVRKWADILPENNRGLEVIPQLIGNQPSHFVDTIKELQQFGYQRFNWNIGCPSHQVVRKQRGCGLMPFPDRVEAVVREVAKHTDCRFSIKMRLGLKSAEESLRIVERLCPYPLDFLCVHPRLGVQEYEGTPDLTALQRIIAATSHTILYSGDITDRSSFDRIAAALPTVTTFMLGRGLLRNIFLAEELAGAAPCGNGKSKQQRWTAFYQDLTDTLFEARGEHALAPLKELWHYFRHFWQIPDIDLQQLLRKNTWKEFVDFSNLLISSKINQP